MIIIRLHGAGRDGTQLPASALDGLRDRLGERAVIDTLVIHILQVKFLDGIDGVERGNRNGARALDGRLCDDILTVLAFRVFEHDTVILIYRVQARD